MPASSVPCRDCNPTQLPISHLLTCVQPNVSVAFPSFEPAKAFQPAPLFGLNDFTYAPTVGHSPNSASYHLKLPNPVPLYLLHLSILS